MGAEVKALDQANFASVKAFADDLEAEGRPISILVANVGVSLQKYNATSDGWEETCVVRHVSHFSFLIVSQFASEPPIDRPGNHFVTASPDPGRQGRVPASYRRRRKFDALLGQSIQGRSGWCRHP